MKANNFGKKGWYVIIIAFFVYMFTSTPSDILNVTLDGFALRIGLESSAPLMIYSAIGGFLGVPLALIAGAFVEKKGFRMPGFIMLAFMGVLWFCYANSHTLVGYAIVAILIAAVTNVVNLVITQQMMNNWFPRKKGIALGWSSMGMCCDSATMITVFQVMIVKFGLAAPFYLMLVITAVLAIVLVTTVKNYPEEAGAYPDNEPITEEERKKNLEMFDSHKSEFPLKRIFTTKDFWLLVIAFGFMFIGLFGAMTQMVPRMVSIGFTVNDALMWLTIASVVGLPASFIWGVIDHKIGTKPTCIIYSVAWFIMMVLATVGCGTLSRAATISSLVFLACLVGGMGNLMPSMVINVFGRFEFAHVNKFIVAFVLGIRNLSFIIIPFMVARAGLGNEAIGYRNVYAVFALLSGIAVVCTLLVSKNSIVEQKA